MIGHDRGGNGGCETGGETSWQVEEKCEGGIDVEVDGRGERIKLLLLSF